MSLPAPLPFVPTSSLASDPSPSLISAEPVLRVASFRDLSDIGQETSASARQIAAAVGQQDVGIQQIAAEGESLSQMTEEVPRAGTAGLARARLPRSGTKTHAASALRALTYATP